MVVADGKTFLHLMTTYDNLSYFFIKVLTETYTMIAFCSLYCVNVF